MASSTLQVMDLTSLKAVLADLSNQILPSRFERPSSQTRTVSSWVSAR